MADGLNEPTDPGRWIDPQGSSPAGDDAETLRRAFREDQYGDGTDDMLAEGRAQGFRRALLAIVLLLLAVVLALVILLVVNGGDDDDTTTTDDDSDVTDIDEADTGDDTDPDEVDEVEDPPADDPVEDEPVDDPPGDDAPDDEPVVDPPVAELGTTGDPALDQVLLAVGADPGDERIRFLTDELGDMLDSISANSPTFVRGDVDIAKVIEILLGMSTEEVARVFNQSTIECGATEPFLVVCAPGELDMPEGEVLALGMTLDAPVPPADADRSFTYSAVFDSDGDPANNWVFNPPFDFDLFQNADRWYQLVWDHTTQAWSLSVSQVGADQTVSVVESSVRAAVSGSNVVFFVPRSEVGDGAYRLTSFGHDGAFSESDRGADVSGVDPTEPLTMPTAELIETVPQ